MRIDNQRLPDRLQATFVPSDGTTRTGHLAFWGTDDPASALRALGVDDDGAHGKLTTVLPRTARAYKRVVFAEVPAATVALLPAVRALVALDLHTVPAWRVPGASVRAWQQAARLGVEVVAAGHLVPSLHTVPTDIDSDTGPHVDTDTSRLATRWRVAIAGDLRPAQLAAAMPVAAHAVAYATGHAGGDSRGGKDNAVWTALELLNRFLDDLADDLVRFGTDAPGPGNRHDQRGGGQRRGADRDPGNGTCDGTGSDPEQGSATPLDRVVLQAAVTIPADRLVADLGDWTAPVVAGGAASARLCVRLSTPPDHEPSTEHEGEGVRHDASGQPEDRWPLDYLLQATHDPSLVVDAADVWATTGPGVADHHLPDAQEALARGLGEAARLFAPIDASLSQPRPTSLDLTSEQAAVLLTDGAAALSAAGLGVQLPAELTRTGQARLKARMRVGTSRTAPGGGPGGLDLGQLGAFTWEVAIEGDALTAEEFAELAAHKRSLVRWRGRWVHVDPDQLDVFAEAIDADGRLDVSTAMAALLSGVVDDDQLGAVEVVADGTAIDLLARLAGTDPPPPRLDGIDATLRPYQHRGVSWLQARADLGLGSVLADDMGLGKTLQSIVLVAGRDGSRPHLVVCPASVVGNWEREIARFAPHLDVVRHHGADRPDTVDGFPPGGITVTTYGTLRSDADLVCAVDWDVVVLDEAQAFKNPTTRTARTVRALAATVKVAMTGTPVENRLSELWSIMDVAVPGLLGGFTAFDRDLARPIERWGDRDATMKLRRLTAPFVLRRTKRDPEIAADLPDKQVQVEPVWLTTEQATLYQAVVDETFESDLGEGIERRGAVLKLLTALKQVCNHPAQYLGQSGPLAGRSGKLARTTDLLTEVVEAGDRALVFTQYRRMGDLLARHLVDRLDLPDVPFLHGGTTLRRRDELVEAFQNDETASPVLLVSLKAGGTGLNLTRATHVVHYDRWWNPAVEDQATDRAYRIGQERTVFVHTLTTLGTLEERIAEMLERKRDLADAVVGTGEAWLTELDDDALRDLVTLDRAADGVVPDDLQVGR